VINETAFQKKKSLAPKTRQHPPNAALPVAGGRQENKTGLFELEAGQALY
jgi:hypothetical protein